MSQVSRQFAVWMLLPFVLFLQGCPRSDSQVSSRVEPSSREELDLGSHVARDTAGLVGRTSHQAQVAVGPDSTLVGLEWATGARNGRRVPYRVSVIIPEHPESDHFIPKITGVAPGQPDSTFAATVAIEHTRTRGSRAITNTVLVELGGDGNLRVLNP
jgi:hypothetical protein